MFSDNLNFTENIKLAIYYEKQKIQKVKSNLSTFFPYFATWVQTKVQELCVSD